MQDAPRTNSKRIIAIDWSGAMVGAAQRIWRADVVSGELVYLANGFSQDDVTAQLIELASAERGLAVGLDFAFSLPAWFLEHEHIANAPELWRRITEEDLGEAWLAACEPPFWGRRGSKKPLDGDGERTLFRRTESDVHQATGFRPKSVFQIAGAGAVGTASLRGMRALHRLRGADFSIWPYDDPGAHNVVEIYPRVFTGAVRKSNPSAREAYISARAEIASRFRPAIIASEDAFDAAISALEMARHHEALTRLPPARDAIERLEGAIWLP